MMWTFRRMEQRSGVGIRTLHARAKKLGYAGLRPKYETRLLFTIAEARAIMRKPKAGRRFKEDR